MNYRMFKIAAPQEAKSLGQQLGEYGVLDAYEKKLPYSESTKAMQDYYGKIGLLPPAGTGTYPVSSSESYGKFQNKEHLLFPSFLGDIEGWHIPVQPYDYIGHAMYGGNTNAALNDREKANTRRKEFQNLSQDKKKYLGFYLNEDPVNSGAHYGKTVKMPYAMPVATGRSAADVTNGQAILKPQLGSDYASDSDEELLHMYTGSVYNSDGSSSKGGSVFDGIKGMKTFGGDDRKSGQQSVGKRSAEYYDLNTLKNAPDLTGSYRFDPGEMVMQMQKIKALFRNAGYSVEKHPELTMDFIANEIYNPGSAIRKAIDSGDNRILQPGGKGTKYNINTFRFGPNNTEQFWDPVIMYMQQKLRNGGEANQATERIDNLFLQARNTPGHSQVPGFGSVQETRTI